MSPSKRIMFVDDEANVLSGLRRLLRTQRDVWEMHFCGGGTDALELMKTLAFDVVVSDMRMPGMDGAELLTRVAELYPDTVRLVLSGQSEHEKIFRAIGPAHQFMSKPCDPAVLIGTIDRACTLQSQMHDESLRRVVTQIEFLPSLPRIYHDLVVKLESDESSLDEIGEMISHDISMTAKVLQLVNSSFFGLPQHVTCPKHAVSLLGLNIIRPLVLTVGTYAQFDDPKLAGYSLEESINHSLAVAMTARAIAATQTSSIQLVDDSFIAGMMHDIGKIILAVNLRDRYASAIELALAEVIPLWQAEQQVFSTTHAEIGAHLLGLWGLPHPIVEAVAFHHRPNDSGNALFSPLTAVHIANVLHQDATAKGTPCTYDRDYVTAAGVQRHLNQWEASARLLGAA